jgi:hypothetical protein
MITDLAELLIRLRVHFELLEHEHPFEEDQAPHPLGFALLSAADLLDEMQRSLQRDQGVKLAAVIRAWQRRSIDGRPVPKAV